MQEKSAFATSDTNDARCTHSFLLSSNPRKGFAAEYFDCADITSFIESKHRR
jgi:hypothetical protein